ncbi:MAG TPA: class I SAM-dependent methyltransferase [Ktedonobacteraceae bacterium]|nr:class I SAM-dependent methyltransferase [Ktedonobacteraceae bacterium]
MAQSSEIWTGVASLYDETRPSPPPVLPTILTQWIHTRRPSLVVDLGSGTGLSTMIWGGRAQHVIGIEPNADMRAQAIRKLEHHPYAANIEFREGVASHTGLPDNSVDIVTCSQSFHWMEPTTTLDEIGRILRPGGLFAAYDYDWPPTICWELELVYKEVDERFEALEQERGIEQNLPKWPKSGHLARMRESGQFRLRRELLLHHVEQGNAERFIGMLMTSTFGHHFEMHTITEHEIDFDRLKRAAHQYIGSEPVPWYLSYRVRVGVK